MGRRSGFAGMVNSAIRAQARANRQAVAEYNRQVRAQERMARQLVRDQKQYEKELRQQYLVDRQEETDEQNIELQERLDELGSVLEGTLSVDDRIVFDSLKLSDNFAPIQIPKELATPTQKPTKYDVKLPYECKRLGIVEKLIHGEHGKNDRILQYNEEYESRRESEYKKSLIQFENAEKIRLEKLEALKAEYEKSKAGFLQMVAERNAEVDDLQKRYEANDPDAIVTYSVMVLEKSSYPEGFPQEFRLAYVPESKELVIDYELPTADIIPSIAEYKFIKARDEVQEKPRKPAEIKTLYQDVVASVCLRTIHEVLEADQREHIALVTLNGFVQTVDRTTGKDIRPYLISARVTREGFLDIDLTRIDKRACLRNLGAQVSPAPMEYIAIKPIVNFDMVDKRFVEGSDVLSELDGRPNLMDLTPFEFENLVGNLFTQMGLDTRQTQTSRDGGVDVIAYDTRPIFGGKVVIQAKRYKHTVGVNAARDLYGTMINEGANKGILIATSHYGKATYDFVKDKPIELVDGPGMLYLLEHHANIKARIIMPEEPE